MAKKRRALSPEELEWEATREERTRYLYGRLNRTWAEVKAREDAKERTQGSESTPAAIRWRVLRRLRRFR